MYNFFSCCDPGGFLLRTDFLSFNLGKISAQSTDAVLVEATVV